MGSEMCIRDRPKSVICRRRRIGRPISCGFRTSNLICRELRIRRPFLPRNHVPNFMRHQQQVPPCILAPPTLRPNRSSAAADELGVRFRADLGPRIGFAEHSEFDVRFCPETTCRISCTTSSRYPLAFLLLLLSAQIVHLPPPTNWASDFVGI